MNNFALNLLETKSHDISQSKKFVCRAKLNYFLNLLQGLFPVTTQHGVFLYLVLRKDDYINQSNLPTDKFPSFNEVKFFPEWLLGGSANSAPWKCQEEQVQVTLLGDFSDKYQHLKTKLLGFNNSEAA